MTDIAAHVGGTEQEHKMPATFPLLTAALYKAKCAFKGELKGVSGRVHVVGVCNCSISWGNLDVGVDIGIPVASPWR